MQRWLAVLRTALLLAPFAVAATCLLRRLRPSRSWRRSIAEAGMIFGTLPWIWMIMTPVEVPPGTTMVHLVPLADLKYLVETRQAVIQIGGNLAVLLALGAFAPIRWALLATLPRVFALGAGTSFMLETVQYALISGRVFSVDDILLNAVGCMLGGLLSRPWWHRVPGEMEPVAK